MIEEGKKFAGFKKTHSPRQRLASMSEAMELVANLAVCHTQFEDGKPALWEIERALCFDNFILRAREVLGLVALRNGPVIYYDHLFDAHCHEQWLSLRMKLFGMRD